MITGKAAQLILPGKKKEIITIYAIAIKLNDILKYSYRVRSGHKRW